MKSAVFSSPNLGLRSAKGESDRRAAGTGERMPSPDGLALGPWSRGLEAAALARRPIWYRLARRTGIALTDLGRILWYAPRLALRVRALCGVPALQQIRDQLALAFGRGMDPSIYYFEELYKPGALDHIDQYFLRREVKGELLALLHRLQPPVGERRVNLGDKMQLFAWCKRAGLAHAAPLMLIEDGQVVWQTPNLLELDQDLFAKPRRGRGANGVDLFVRTAAFQYRDTRGRNRLLGDVVSDLIRRHGSRNLMVLPRLRNHPDFADLATQSLITIRAVTVLDEQGEPELVVAYLRVLAKLEDAWPEMKPISEYAAAVDLESGCLGPITGDKPECLSVWHDRHPVTGVPVTGRKVPCWPEVVQLATRAHQVIRDRVLVGWDIAITPQGPILLEGNSYPDVHYPQRIHRRPYGEMRIGQLLRHHMARLEESWATVKLPPR
jgi:hypothetical protein